MISDGHNLMLNSREVYKLRSILRDLTERKLYWFGDSEEEQIMSKWCDQLQFAMAACEIDPYKKIES